MRKTLRGLAVALTLAAVMPVVAAPALAAPSPDRSPDGSVGALSAFDDLVAALAGWLEGWLDESPMQHVTARGGHTVDPDGSKGSAPADVGIVMAEGGHTVDPDG